jgi:membrane protease YdiL (CAAX protease family)
MNKETRDLLIFFIATFVWTWAFYAPIAMGGHSPYEMPWTILLIFGGMGPSVVGVVMVLFMKDKEQRRDTWRRCFSFNRIGAKWWLVIFVTFPVIYGLGILIDSALGGSLPGMLLLKDLIANPAVIPLAVFIRFMSGPWAEEFGWRGYALDRILQPLGAIPGSILLGVIWGVWHLPLFFMPATWHGQVGFAFSGFWTFILLSIALSLFMTWIYLNTDRSILSGMMIHFTSNFTGQLLAPVSEQVEVIRVLILLAVGIIVCLFMSNKNQMVWQMQNRPTGRKQKVIQ